ncbi:AEC family transporter [Maritalea porphyrae]|uniref:Malonate transporter n=1 Tax=Maritalea porphyrae TaxID=880732 RepID=A0ABQ5USB2_9HYPH|nr:AEC family transporter [Maritalea porphyrae]GLQ17650.1 malonate transporter [Maritalea porphyrae]
MYFVIDVVAPVFVIVLLGYVAVKLRIFPSGGINALIAFTNNFAAPMLLFRAMLTLDFSTALDPKIILPFYVAGISGFVLGIILARKLFAYRPGEAVSVGFSALFTNTVLLGIPIVQRAYGVEALPIIFLIIGFHAPSLMTIGMLTMELSRRDGRPLSVAILDALKRIVSNPLLIGIACGVALNLSGLKLPKVLDDATSMMVAAVLPTALFGLGAALTQYSIKKAVLPAAAMSAIKTIMHPLLAWIILVPILGMPHEIARAVVLLAAMPSGINAYIFATYYNRALDVATSTVLLSTLVSIFSISFWLWFLS